MIDKLAFYKHSCMKKDMKNRRLSEEVVTLRRMLKKRARPLKAIVTLIVKRMLKDQSEVDGWVNFLLPKVRAELRKELQEANIVKHKT